MSAKHSPSNKPRPSLAEPPAPPKARTGRHVLRSATVGALPILNHFLRRMRLEDFLRSALPPEDRRTKLSPVKALLVLLRNLLLSREPIYGVGEWAARHAPQTLGLLSQDLPRLNDDGVGRALDRLFMADVPSLVLAVATHVVKEFGVTLDELHNDSTTVTFCGAYTQAATSQRYLGRPTLAITFGHNKDHRPDLKQLLFILTVTADGGVPLHFRAESGNVTDDQTHRDTWDLLCQLTGRRDFLYVADCKLATSENMAYLHQRQGRFVTILPRTRSEDAAFRQRLAKGQIAWRRLWEKTDEEGEVLDRYSTSDQPTTTVEGYRLVWYHSLRKAEQDAVTRSGRIERALKQLAALKEKLHSPRTRYRQQAKVAAAVATVLEDCGAAEWIATAVQPQTEETFHQDHRGRPGQQTRYVKKVATRFDLSYRIDEAARGRGRPQRRHLSPGDQRGEVQRIGAVAGLQAAAGDREAFLAVEDRLRGGAGVSQGGASYSGVAVHVLLRPSGGGPLGAATASGDAAKRDRSIAPVSRGPCLPSADGPACDRPVRDRPAAHAGTAGASHGGHGHGLDSSATQAPQAHWPVGQALRSLTCRPAEIRRK